MLKQSFFGSLAAGVMLTIGAGVFLSCDNKVVGAVAFSVALMVICMLGMYLYTGKIGMLAEDYSPVNLGCVTVGLIGNYITATLGGLVLGLVKPALYEKAVTMCEAKLEQKWYIAIILGIFCGILMYTAVKGYANTKQPIILVFCVAVFILSGYEHSIADMAYFGVARMFGLKTVCFILLVVLGNTIGGMLIPLLMKGAKKNEKN
ncbi:MAG: formate/nitrite transporter family protein [Clostridia bacterium]|nr:formate/nitrite transporter family protein [Clostridia bacterium]